MLMEFADHFSRIAAGYAQFRPRYPGALVDVLADRSPGPIAWDIGCGSGQLSVALAERFTQVIATDPAQAQLAEAVAHPHVEYRCAPAEASGLADHSVDLAVAAQSAHWFHWPTFLVEVARVARPGALIALVSYGIVRVDGPGAELVDHFYHQVVGPYWPPGRAHVENGYRDLGLPWPAVEAPPLEMTASWQRDEMIGYLGTWSATVKLIEREGLGPVQEIAERLAAVWPDGQARTIRWPLTVKLARR